MPNLRLFKLLLPLVLLATAFGQTTRTYPALETDNAFTGKNTFKALGSIRFADQFANIQAAIDDAGGTGAVLIPRDYAGSDSFTNLSRIPIIDLRGASGHWRGKDYFAGDFGAKGDGIADDTAAIQEALDAAHDGGGSEVILAAGTYIITQLKLRDGVGLRGAGRDVTTLKLKNSANVDIIIRHPSDTGLQVGIADLTINGNDGNNTQGGFYWDGANDVRGPSLVVDNVKITHTRPAIGDGSPSGAFHLKGNVWSVVKNSDFTDNHYAPGLWTKGSDGRFTGNYYGNNGDLATQCSGVCPNVVVQAGAGNRFIGEYIGGNGGREQVQLWGASRNFFINCVNDNAAQHGYALIDFSGQSSDDNVFVGGQVTGPQPSYPSNAVDAFSFQGGASGNLVSGVLIDSYTATVWRYGINETDTAGNNIFVGGAVGRNNTPGTGTINWRSGGGSLNRGVSGVSDSPYDSLDLAGKITRYNSVATAGNGIASIYGATAQKSETAADANVLTFTPPASAGTYRITFALSLSAANAATLGWTATWKDSNGNAQAPTNLSLFQSGTAAPALTFTTSAAGNYYAQADVDVDNSATSIVVKLTFSGTSFAGKVSATIERIN